jgi:import receptor subunit TOM20
MMMMMIIGDGNTLESAVSFYHAVKVYPNPVDLLVILQKSVPEEIVTLVYSMITTEVQISKMMEGQQLEC